MQKQNKLFMTVLHSCFKFWFPSKNTIIYTVVPKSYVQQDFCF